METSDCYQISVEKRALNLIANVKNRMHDVKGKIRNEVIGTKKEKKYTDLIRIERYKCKDRDRKRKKEIDVQR